MNSLEKSKFHKRFQFKKKEILALAVIFFAAVLGGMFLGLIISEVKNQTAMKKLLAFQPKVPTRLYDIRGELISELFREKRELAEFDEMPQNLINAFLSIEDGNFYRHFGIDFEGILRAAIKNIKARRVVEGGSTITQQLAKGLFTKSEKTFGRKAMEAVYALQIEKEHSKNQILEMYFNQIYFGHGAYGIKSAARFYFNKEVQDLNLVECAILAALPKSPHSYSPIRSTHRSYARNRVVLGLMVEKGFLTRERVDDAYSKFWPAYVDKIKYRAPSETAFGQKIDKAPYFTDYVRQILIARYGEEKIYNDGYLVYTTLDLTRQRAAQKHLWETLDRYQKISSGANRYSSGAVDRTLFSRYNTLRSFFSLASLDVRNTEMGLYKRWFKSELADAVDIVLLATSGGDVSKAIEGFRQETSKFHSNLHVQGALISMEPHTGYISSMVGGMPFSTTNQFNRAMKAMRQPGSAFKPFVYTAAIDSRQFATGSVELDAPMTDVTEDGGVWTPENYGQKNRGPVSLKRALASSLNVISVRLYDRIGPDRIIDIASRMMKVPISRFSPNPSLALGASEVTPYEMATGFSVFANEGKEVIPFAVRFINDRNGNQMSNSEFEIWRNQALKEKDESIQILPKALNWIIADLLQFVVNYGTAHTVVEEGFRRPVAGKTGTTQNWADGWFAGFTPNLTTVIWLGYDDRSLTLGSRGSGGSSAAPLFGRYMVDALANTEVAHFPSQPGGVYAGSFCSVCNGWPSEHCPKDKRHSGYFLGGFGVHKCPQEAWEHWDYQSINDRFKEVQGITEEMLKKRLEEKFLNQNSAAKKEEGSTKKE
jgi:penicillin-binding protein 1A